MSVAEIFHSMDYGPAPEGPAAAEEWIARHDGKFGLFIAGGWRVPAADLRFASVNPATAKPIARIAQAGQKDVDAAVVAARAAQGGWAKLGGHGRARYIYACSSRIRAKDHTNRVGNIPVAR